MDKPPIDEKSREEVEAERKAKRAAKQERKKTALEKLKTDGKENQQKSQNLSSEPPKGQDTSERVKVSKPKSVSTLRIKMHLFYIGTYLF